MVNENFRKLLVDNYPNASLFQDFSVCLLFDKLFSISFNFCLNKICLQNNEKNDQISKSSNLVRARAVFLSISSKSQQIVKKTT